MTDDLDLAAVMRDMVRLVRLLADRPFPTYDGASTGRADGDFCSLCHGEVSYSLGSAAVVEIWADHDPGCAWLLACRLFNELRLVSRSSPPEPPGPRSPTENPGSPPGGHTAP